MNYTITDRARIVCLVVVLGAFALIMSGAFMKSLVASLLAVLGLGIMLGVQIMWQLFRPQPWLWPLLGVPRKLSKDDGSFGFRRKHETHTGVDLYCAEGQEVQAVEDGEVLLITDFTGEKAGSPWWNPTKAVLVRPWSDGQVVVYGEIEPLATLKVGARVFRGQPLGNVLRVRKEDHGKPMTMLHFELWASTEDVLRNYTLDKAAVANDWPLDAEQPAGLLNPTQRLKEAEVL